jgi:hypothetical protein
MKEPECPDGYNFNTLHENEEETWVLRRSTDAAPIIAMWLSHYCGSVYQHRFEDEGWGEDNNFSPLASPCITCGAVAPDGMQALYRLLRWGLDG